MTDQGQDFSDELGVDYFQPFAFTDTASGEPLDVTNDPITFVFRDASGQEAMVLTDTNGGVTKSNPTGGVVELQLTQAIKDAASIQAGTYALYAYTTHEGRTQGLAEGTYILAEDRTTDLTGPGPT